MRFLSAFGPSATSASGPLAANKPTSGVPQDTTSHFCVCTAAKFIPIQPHPRDPGFISDFQNLA